jgi:uncharacterized protein YbaP (TraB family)
MGSKQGPNFMKALGFAALALAMGTPALAKTKISFAAYEGTGSNVITGKGGTKVSENGIDYWTTGDPPRPFHYLGAMKVVGDDPIGRKDVAKEAVKAGGDAVVLKRSDTQAFMAHTEAHKIQGFDVTMPATNRLQHETTSVLAVIKYVEQDK